MRQVKKPKPAGACTVCRAPTELHESLNNRCRSTLNGRRCYGVYKSDLSYIWGGGQASGGTVTWVASAAPLIERISECL